MKDPLSPSARDPYQFLGLSYDSTPSQAETAMDDYNRDVFGHELEAVDACAAIRDPARRLAIDLLRYHSRSAPTDIETVNAGFERTLRQLEAKIRALTLGLDFGQPKTPALVEELIRSLDDSV